MSLNTKATLVQITKSYLTHVIVVNDDAYFVN